MIARLGVVIQLTLWVLAAVVGGSLAVCAAAVLAAPVMATSYVICGDALRPLRKILTP